MSARLLIVSNRLPIRARVEHKQVVLEPTVGGLASGLREPHRTTGGLWIGWPGDTTRFDPHQRLALDARLAEGRFVPVHLSPSEIQRYYDGLSNSVLWPLFHGMPDRIPLGSRDWSAYADVNARFADAVTEAWQPGDAVWVHDYHLLLLPALLRERLPEARIGLFLHIPFPASDLFRVLPWRTELLAGMLGADLLGFQTHGDLQNFFTAALRVLGIEPDLDRLAWGGRTVVGAVHPIGIDFHAFDGATVTPKAASAVSAVRGSLDPGARTRILLGIDRLDYTKGIPRRLLAFERLLERHPRWRQRVRLLQIAVPSRESVGAYRELRDQVDALVGRINGDWSTFGWAPIQLLHRSFAPDDVIALYRAADVMLVTPLRDGMNLVAKEFVAARRDEDGVLVLSEFAGAAPELGEAVLVNPYGLDAFADALHRALAMPDDERQQRMRTLRSRVRTSDIAGWADRFVAELRALAQTRAPRLLDPPEETALRARLADAPARVLLLDHDGTLVALAPTPERAEPDDELIALLGALAAQADTVVHIVSGRDARTLERWYGELDVHLHAEHAAAWRAPGADWVTSVSHGAWRPHVREVMETFARRTAGARVEDKAFALAWHYRLADLAFGAAMARELRHHLRAVLAGAPAEVIGGNKVVEVRPLGAHKGRAVTVALELAPPGAAVLAIGDDRTDVDLFDALPAGAVSIAVGDRILGATYRVPGVDGVRALLRRIASAQTPARDVRRPAPPDPPSFTR